MGVLAEAIVASKRLPHGGMTVTRHLRAGRRLLTGRGRPDIKAYLVDGVVGVAERVPLRLVPLGPPSHVGGPGPDRDVAVPGQAGGQLPPPPALATAVTGQGGRLPGGIVDGHLHPGAGRRSRPGPAPGREVAWPGPFPRA